jgi:hypothetical protein
MPWVWEQPEGLKGKDTNAVIVTDIEFKEIKK